MNVLDLQKFLFEHNPSRLELVDYTPSNSYTAYTISVYRNHSFELVEHTIKAYLDYAQMTPHFEYSDYDDSLSFSNINTSADIIILWLDCSRYKTISVYEFITGRIHYLRTVFKKNILLALLNGEDYTFSISGVYTLDLQTIKNALGKKYLDERLEAFSGTKLSSYSLIEISKTLALRYFPALLSPLIKAIVVDLDNTLYQGVLGEDGIDGIILSEGHSKLQQFLSDLSKKGILICAASKNNSDDVKEMFDKRNDFSLKWDDFSKVCASWELKSASIQEIKKYLNINEDSMIFIDDTSAEIIEVMSVFPNIRVIQASQDANVTCRVLESFPGIFRFANHREDSLRNDDIKANEKRYELQRSLSPDEYIKSLNMVLTYKINEHNDIHRIVELSNKTNQFIFSYKRYTAAEISECVDSESSVVISIHLKDKLSDSGLIGVIVITGKNKTAVLDEICISCRALGRGIEEIMILNAIKIALARLNTSLLKVNFIKGERNAPALLFVNKHLSHYVNDATVFKYQGNQNLVEVCVEG